MSQPRRRWTLRLLYDQPNLATLYLRIRQRSHREAGAERVLALAGNFGAPMQPVPTQVQRAVYWKEMLMTPMRQRSLECQARTLSDVASTVYSRPRLSRVATSLVEHTRQSRNLR